MKDLSQIEHQHQKRPNVEIDFQIINIAHSRIFTELNRADLLLQQQPNQDSQHKRAAVEDFLEGMKALIEHEYKRLKEAFNE